jgi:hypothetical protein
MLSDIEIDGWLRKIQEVQSQTTRKLENDGDIDEDRHNMKLLSLLNTVSINVLKLKQLLKKK